MVDQTTTSKLDAITQAILGGSTGPSTSQLLQAVQAQQPTGVQLADRLSQLGAGAAIYGDQRNAAMQGFVNSMTGKRASAQDAAMARVADLDANDPVQQQQILNILKASDPAKAVEFARAIQQKKLEQKEAEVTQAQTMSQRNSLATLAIERGAPELAAPILTGALKGKEVTDAMKDLSSTKGEMTEAQKAELMKDFTAESVTAFLESDSPTRASLLVEKDKQPGNTTLANQVTEAYGYTPGTPQHQRVMQRLMEAKRAGDAGEYTPAQEIGVISGALKEVPTYDDSLRNISNLRQAARAFDLMENGDTNARTGMLRNVISVYQGSQRAQAEIDSWVSERNLGQRFNDWVQTAISGDTSDETIRELGNIIKDNLAKFESDIVTALDAVSSTYRGIVSDDSINRVVSAQRTLAGIGEQSTDVEAIVNRVLNRKDFKFYEQRI